MGGGRLLQVGAPEEVYRRPRTPFVARALGEVNLLPGESMGRPGGTVLVRPEGCVLGPAANGCPWSWPGRVRAVSFLGADVLVEMVCAGGLELRVRARAAEVPGPGEAVRVGIPEDAAWPIPETDGGLA
jgi:ABC-type Fe3+/spermidine/putrescine transport system ATPase subunit